MVIAQQAVVVPSVAAAAAIGLVHAQRNPWSTRAREETATIEDVVSDEFSTIERDSLYAVASGGGAVWVLRDFIARMCLGDVVVDADESQRRAWNLHLQYAGDGSTVGWWEHLRGVAPSEIIRVLVRAIWVKRSDVPRNDVDCLPSRSEAWRYQVRRWRRGLRATIHLIRRSGGLNP